MINVRTIKKMQDGDTLNIKNGKIKKYKGGFQVNVKTYDVDIPEMAIFAVKMLNTLDGGCSIQFKNGKYYISSTKHAYTRRQAREIANKVGQNIIYEWQNLAHQAI